MLNQYDGWRNGQTACPEGAFTKPTPLCPRVHLWAAPDIMAKMLLATQRPALIDKNIEGI
jgi:hypothetical protein